MQHPPGRPCPRAIRQLTPSLAVLLALQAGPVTDFVPLIDATRQAIGGEARIGAVRTIVINGRTRQVQGNNLVPIEFEIACEFPDKCVRRDEIPARESGPTTIGFNGNELVQLPVPTAQPPRGGPPPGRDGAPPGGGRAPSPEAQRAARLGTVQQDFARLLLGTFAARHGAFPVTFGFVGEAEAPQGKADVLEVKGPGNFAARFFIFKESHLPVMLTWSAPSPGGPVENRLFYADYREVDGLKLPFRLRRAVGADTIEETTIDRIRLNTKVDPRRFEVRR